MAIHVRRLERWRHLADAARAPLGGAPELGCPRCADLGAAVRELTAEVERLRAPYATAFRDGAAGALDFAARAFEAMGDRRSASLLRQMRGTVDA
ncbi:MAG TPA: hypothetical protein VFP65_13085 [Anaeromyxobacteraceae bacterium]|nr:hypothetical protein [Anaeromyxobacteraceae bacterium]